MFMLLCSCNSDVPSLPPHTHTQPYSPVLFDAGSVHSELLTGNWREKLPAI